jgi:hypothetical protein
MVAKLREAEPIEAIEENGALGGELGIRGKGPNFEGAPQKVSRSGINARTFRSSGIQTGRAGVEEMGPVFSARGPVSWRPPLASGKLPHFRR